MLLIFLMIRRPPRSTRTDTHFPYTTLFRSTVVAVLDQFLGHFQADIGLRFGSRPTPISPRARSRRSEEHTSELQSLMRSSYAVLCLKKKNQANRKDSRSNTGWYRMRNSTRSSNMRGPDLISMQLRNHT